MISFFKQPLLVFMLIGAFYGHAQNTKNLTAAKTYPDSYQDFEETLASVYHFNLPQRIPVTAGKAGNGTASFTFSYRNSGLVTCVYNANAAGTAYEFASGPAGLAPGSIIGTDYLRLRVNSGDPAAGITQVVLPLTKLVLPKTAMQSPFPRRFPPIPGQSGMRVGAQQNCATPTAICNANFIFEPDAYSLQGNEINPANSCLATGAINGVWYSFTAAINGILNFTISPLVTTDDYDWAVYNITGATCANIATNPALQVACNYSGDVSFNGTTGPNGQAGSPFTPTIPVVAGNTYRIFVSYFNGGVPLNATQGAGHGFNLNLVSSTPNLFGQPTITATTSSPAICAGASATLTATGAGVGGTYVWSPATGLSSTTGSSVTASPTTGTNYMVTGTTAGGCSNISFVYVHVNPTPVLTVTPPSATTCGGPVTLMANGAWNYTWSPAINISSTSAQNVTVNPSSTTTYTVTGHMGVCTATRTVTITVAPLTINVTPSAASICTGASATLTASGGSTYSWSPATGLNTTTGATVIATPTVATTYTVTGTNGNCSGTKTVTVTPGPCTGCANTPVYRYSKISATQGNLNTSGFYFSGGINYIGRDETPIGDFDGDGIEDMIVSAARQVGSFNQGSISVLLLNANGTVKNQVDITEGLNGFTDPVPHTEYNFHPGASFASSITYLGDIDGPGGSKGAVAVGVPHDDDGSYSYYNVAYGAVYILFLNPNGTVMKSQKISKTQGNFTGNLQGSLPGGGAYACGIDGGEFGQSVEYLGDMDGAGPSVATLAVGSDGIDNGYCSNSGKLYILSLDINGMVISHKEIGSEIAGLSTIFRFGRDIQNLGDLDGAGPGALTLAVASAWNMYLVTIDASGNYLSHTVFNASHPGINASSGSNAFHKGLATLGDMDGAGPGITTLVFGLSNIVYLVNIGPGNLPLGHYKIANGYLGLSLDASDIDFGLGGIANIGDLNNDNIPELAVTAPYDIDGGSATNDWKGAVYLLSVCPDLFFRPYMREGNLADAAVTTETSAVLVSPNPFASDFSITLPEGETLAQVQVSTLSGQVIGTYNTLSLGAGFNPGMYMLKITTNKGSYYKKVIKE